jgi:hypothetical protein
LKFFKKQNGAFEFIAVNDGQLITFRPFLARREFSGPQKSPALANGAFGKFTKPCYVTA